MDSSCTWCPSCSPGTTTLRQPSRQPHRARTHQGRVVRSASRIMSATTLGWEIIATWEELISRVSGFHPVGHEPLGAGGMARSWRATSTKDRDVGPCGRAGVLSERGRAPSLRSRRRRPRRRGPRLGEPVLGSSSVFPSSGFVNPTLTVVARPCCSATHHRRPHRVNIRCRDRSRRQSGWRSRSNAQLVAHEAATAARDTAMRPSENHWRGAASDGRGVN